MAKESAVTTSTLVEVVLDLFRVLKPQERALIKKEILAETKEETWDLLCETARKYASKKKLTEEQLLKSVEEDRYGKA